MGSRVASDQAAITQLRALLKHAGDVGGLLSVQDQINDETSNLESMLAQQQALDRQTAYATVTLTLVGPKAVVKVKAKAKHKPVPPPGLASGLGGGWRAFRLSVDWLLAIIGAVAPFAAVVVVIGGGVRGGSGGRVTRGGGARAGPAAEQCQRPGDRPLADEQLAEQQLGRAAARAREATSSGDGLAAAGVERDLDSGCAAARPRPSQVAHQVDDPVELIMASNASIHS